jgi:hypothetical protein
VPRSGTTLLRLMLDAHPELAIPPETHFVSRLIKLSRAGELDVHRAYDLIATHPRWGDFGLDADELRRGLFMLDPFTAGDALRTFYRLYAARHGKPRWGDKSPNYVMRMRRITRALPEARFIHLIRDGRDVVVSLRERTWGPGDVAEAADRWVEDIRKARRQIRRPLNPLWWNRVPRYMEVRYEDLVTDAEPHLRRICEFLELPWSEQMLSFHESAKERMQEVVRTVRTRKGTEITAEERARQHELVARPATPDRVGRWQTLLPAEDQATFAERAGDLLAELGYPPGAGDGQSP